MRLMGSMRMGQEVETGEEPTTGVEKKADQEPMASAELKLEEKKKASSELRRSPRLQCSGLAGVQTLPACEKPCPARIINLSIGGCLMELERPLTLALNENVELIFCVNQMPFRVRGKVRALRSETEIGFQFPQLSDRIRRQLEDLVGELIDHLKKLHQESLANRLLQDDAKTPQPNACVPPAVLTRQPLRPSQGLPANAGHQPTLHRRWF